MAGRIPTAFMSYSWDSDEHKEWVHNFATRLRSDGVDVTLDQWHAVPGDQLPHFMETAVRDNDYVIIICTPKYRERSDARTGGVGYEGDIITAELLTTRNHRKFIPVLRGPDWISSAPSWLKGKYYVALNQTPYGERQYSDLLATIHQTRPVAPPVGTPPRQQSKNSSVNVTPASEEPIAITGVLVDEVSTPRMDGTRGSALYTIPFQLSRRPSHEWAEAFVQTWNHPPTYTTSHRPGIARVNGDRIILDGTTIEEVQEVHRNTLVLAVDKANQLTAGYEARKRRKAESEAARLAEHKENVRDTGNAIRFD